jgi:O-6-methylguanine DNA methyltransferase
MKLADKVYMLVRKIPKGKVTTYGFIAKYLKTKAYRAVGQIMKRNPYAPEVPCHRVIKSDGSISGFSGSDPKNIKKKISMLRKEGVPVVKGKISAEFIVDVKEFI